MNEANDTQIGWWFIFGALFFLAWVIIFAAGAAKRIVLFYDYSDMKISAVAAGVGIVAAPLIYVCFAAKPFSSGIANFAFGFIISAAIGFASLYLFWKTIRSAIFYNKSIPIGIAVGIFKISFVLIMVSLITKKSRNT